MNIQIDPEFRKLIPALQSEEYQQLEQNILSDGCRDPLVLWNDTLIDGHNRFEICQRHNIVFNVVQKDFPDRHEAKLWMLRNQLGRRNLPDPVRITLAHEMKKAESEKAKERQIEAGKQHGKGQSIKVVQNSVQPNGNGRTQSKLADTANVSHFKYDQGEHIIENAPEWIKDLWMAETISTNRAYELTNLLKNTHSDVCACIEFYEIVEPDTILILSRLHKNNSETWRVICETGWIQPGDEHEAVHVTDRPIKIQNALNIMAEAHKQLARDVKRQDRIDKLVSVSKNNQDLNDGLGLFPVIYADPPWLYEHTKTDNRKIENHYPTMPLEKICALPVETISTPDAILFMWTTSPKLAESIEVISAWGFIYRTCAVWIKDKIGMGYYFRQRHELLLVAIRGEFPTPPEKARPDSVISAPRGKHSEKPDCIYEIINTMYPDLPKIELFSRNAYPGWKVWGNQA